MKYKLYFGKTIKDWVVLTIKSLIICTLVLVTVGLLWSLTILAFGL